MKTDHDKIMLVHDALAECKGSDKLYLLIHEHYENARFHGPCSEGRDICAQLIGSLVIDAIRRLEKANERANAVGEEAENQLACMADDKNHEMLERGQ